MKRSLLWSEEDLIKSRGNHLSLPLQIPTHHQETTVPLPKAMTAIPIMILTCQTCRQGITKLILCVRCSQERNRPGAARVDQPAAGQKARQAALKNHQNHQPQNEFNPEHTTKRSTFRAMSYLQQPLPDDHHQHHPLSSLTTDRPRIKNLHHHLPRYPHITAVLKLQHLPRHHHTTAIHKPRNLNPHQPWSPYTADTVNLHDHHQQQQSNPTISRQPNLHLISTL